MVKLERIERRKNCNHARTFLSSTQIKGPDLPAANAALDKIAEGHVSDGMIARMLCSASALQFAGAPVSAHSLKSRVHATPPPSQGTRTSRLLRNETVQPF